MKQQLEKLIQDFIGEDINTGEHTYCKNCSGHVAAGECDCIGKNKEKADLRAKVPGLVEEIIKKKVEETRFDVDNQYFSNDLISQIKG